MTAIGATGATGDFGDLAYDSVSARCIGWLVGNNNLYDQHEHRCGDTRRLARRQRHVLARLERHGALRASDERRGHQLNTSNGSATMIGSNNIYPGGFDFNTVTGQMISISAGAGDIKSINLSNGSATQLGNSGNVKRCRYRFSMRAVTAIG